MKPDLPRIQADPAVLLMMLERRAAGGDADAARQYRKVIEMAVRLWAFDLPSGEATTCDLSKLLKDRVPGSKDETALLWALHVARRDFPDGEARFLESAAHEHFRKYADNWLEALRRWVQKHVPSGLREKLIEEAPNFGATDAGCFADWYLLQRAEFMAVARDKNRQRRFNAKFIRGSLRLFVLAELLGDKEVMDALDRSRRVPDHSRREIKASTDNDDWTPEDPLRGEAANDVLVCWLSGALWCVPVKDRSNELERLIGKAYTEGQVHAARRALGLLAESPGRRPDNSA